MPDNEDKLAKSIIATPFYDITEVPNSYYIIVVKGYPIKKISVKNPVKDIIYYTYPTRELYDDEGYLLNGNYNDEINLFVQCKRFGSKLSIWNSVSSTNDLVYIQRLDVYFTNLINKTFTDYSADKTNKLALSLAQQINKLFNNRTSLKMQITNKEI